MSLSKIIKFVVLILAVFMVVGFVLVFNKWAPLFILATLIAFFLILKIIEKPSFGIILTAFLLPFERVGSFELLGFTIRPGQVIALIALLSWGLFFLTTKKKFDARNPLIPFLFLFLAISVLSFIQAVNLERALLVFGFEFFVILVSLAIPNLIDNKKLLQKVILALVLSTFLVSLFGLYQFLGDMAGLPKEVTGLREHYTKSVFGFPRIQSTALEPLYFANFLLIPISLLLVLFLRKKEDQAKERQHFLLRPLGISFILVLSALNLVLTVSRGAYLAFAVVLVLVFVLFFKYFINPKRFVPIILIIFLVGFGVYKLIGLDKRSGIETFIEHSTNFQEGVAIEERFSTYDHAFEMIKRHPVLGVGVGNFGPQIAQNPNNTPTDGWLIVNNLYLEVFAERGIFGIAILLLMMGFVILRSLKALRFGKDVYLKTILLGLTIAFVAILVQYNTFSILYFFHFWFLIGLLISTQNLLLKKGQN